MLHRKKTMSTELWVIFILFIHVPYTKVNNRNENKYTSLFKNPFSAVDKAIIFLGHNIHSWEKKFTYASHEPLSSCIPAENLWALHQKQCISSCIRIIGFPLILRKFYDSLKRGRGCGHEWCNCDNLHLEWFIPMQFKKLNLKKSFYKN